MSPRKTRRAILLLGLLAALSWVLARPGAEEDAKPMEGLDTRLNYALFDFRGRVFNEQGETRLRIEAPLLRSDAATGIGTVQEPDIRIQQEDEEWYITAESAVIAADHENITMSGAVRLVRTNVATGERLDIDTRDVLLNVTPRTAETDSSVHIRQAGSRLDAVGMRLDMINDRVELLSEVRAHYETL